MSAETILRKAIEDYLNGDYSHPRSFRPGDCPHGTLYWLECEQCNTEHFQKALAGAAAAPHREDIDHG